MPSAGRAVLEALLGLAATGAGAAEPASCRATVGAEAATLVAQCIDVSPATHPPCNEANPCQLIRDEIERGCAYIRDAGDSPPAFCAAYPR